jgi:hypothetical protein
MPIWSQPTCSNEDDAWQYEDSDDDTDDSIHHHFNIPSSNNDSIKFGSLSVDSISEYFFAADSLTEEISSGVDSLHLKLEDNDTVDSALVH